MFKAGTLFDLPGGWGRWRLYRSVLLFTMSLLKILIWQKRCCNTLLFQKQLFVFV